MNKHTGFKIVAIAGLMVTSAVFVPTTVQAASWHKGTPKVIRGTYQAKRTSQAAGFGDIYKVTSKYINYQVSNMSQQKTVKLKYKKLKANTYRITGHTQKSGMVLGGHYDSVIYCNHHKLAVDSYSDYKKHGLKYIKKQLKKNPAKLTKKVKNGGRIVH